MTNVFSLRPATAEDHEPIQRVYCDTVGPPTGQERTWRQLITAGCLVVVEVDGEVVGFGGIDVAAVEQLRWLYVLPEYQSSGAGAAMLKQLEEIGWARGLTAIRLHSTPGAVEFYRRQGYREVNDHHQVFHDHEGVAMIKNLPLPLGEGRERV